MEMFKKIVFCVVVTLKSGTDNLRGIASVVKVRGQGGSAPCSDLSPCNMSPLIEYIKSYFMRK